MTWKYKAWHGNTRKGKAWHGKAWQVMKRKGMQRKGMTLHDKSRKHISWKDKETQGMACQ
jgi:hypothetical protein